LPISPEFIKDLKNKTLLENSALKLSISDYELMCRKDKVLNMMAIALNKPKAKLKKFCKHMTVFKENISKSPKSIANKINGPITNLPKDIRSTILEKFAEILPTKYVLLDWIDKAKLNWFWLSKNLNAIDLLENNLNEVDWDVLSTNPNAIELLTNNQDKINWIKLSTNPNAINLLKKRIKYEKSLTNEELNELENKIDWEELSANPNAIELLKKNQDRIKWYLLSLNPNAIKLLENRIEYEKTLIDEELDESENKIDWEYLSANPNAIDLLENNKDKINWTFLSGNPNAIDLLKERIKYEKEERIKYEKSLTDASLDQLKNKIRWALLKNKIDWSWLSQNPNAIELLKKNQDKIDWFELSKNLNAINLLKDRIEYEKSLTYSQFNQLKIKNKINWVELSKNPNAIDLLKENKDKIDWRALSSNSAIFKAV